MPPSKRKSLSSRNLLRASRVALALVGVTWLVLSVSCVSPASHLTPRPTAASPLVPPGGAISGPSPDPEHTSSAPAALSTYEPILPDTAYRLRMLAEISPGDGGLALSALAFSPDSQLLAVGDSGPGDGGQVELWSVPQAERVATLRGHTGWITRLEFSPDGALLVSASRDGSARLWFVLSGNSLATLAGHEGAVWDAAFSPDGTLVATAGDDLTVRFWDARDGRELAVGRAHTDTPRRLFFSPDGELLLSAGEDGRLVIWSVEQLEVLRVLVGHTAPVTDVVFLPAPDRLLSIAADGTMRLWQISDGYPIWEIGTYNRWLTWVRVANIADPLRVISVARDGDMRLWDIPDGEALPIWAIPEAEQIGEMRAATVSIWSLAYNPDERLLALGGSAGMLQLWNTWTGQSVARVYDAHSDGITALAFSPDGRFLATASLDGRVRLWFSDPTVTPTPTWTPGPSATPETPTPTVTGTPPTPTETPESSLTTTITPDGTQTITPIITPSESPTPTPTLEGEVTTEVFPVYDCHYVREDLYEWYSVEVTYLDGVALYATVLEGPVTGLWQPGCPTSEP